MILRVRTITAIFLPLLALAPSARAEELKGKVVLVSEGDTLTLQAATLLTLRLEGVDCPEPGQAFAEQARQRTSLLVVGKLVQATLTGKDAEGNQRARICLAGKRCLAEELLRAGLAWQERERDPGDALAKLEREARAAGRGLWSTVSPTPPWEWRKSHPRLRGTLVREVKGTAAVDVTHPVCVDEKARVAHWFTCPAAKGLSCKLVMPAAAKGRGLKLHTCLTHAASPAPATEAGSADRACKLDRDCTFRPLSGCGCAPCGETRRQAVNRKHAGWLQREYARESCPRAKCSPCKDPVRYLGTQAVCVKGQCEVR